MNILDLHELTIQAVMLRDRNLLLRALAMDPLVNSIATAKAVIADLFEAEKEALLDWPEEEESKIGAPSAEMVAGPQMQLY